MKNALSNVNGWLGGLTGLLKTVVVFFVFAAIVWPTGLPNVIGGIVGHTTENLITKGDASEFIIKPDRGEPYSIVQKNDEELKEGERVLILESDKLRIVRDKNARN